MFRFILIAFLALNSSFAKAQLLVRDSTSRLELMQDSELAAVLKTYAPIYDFRKGEVIASVGAGSGYNEVIYSLMADSLTFYLQDIDIAGLAIPSLEAKVKRIYARADRTYCNATFLTYKGTKTNTNLPDKTFDKIIVEHSLHEFKRPSEMLQSIGSNLKADGVLFILEQIATKPRQKHAGCRKTMFTEKSLITLLHGNDFGLVRQIPVGQGSDRGYIFQFEKRQIK